MPERILAIRLDNVGDVVMLSPALAALSDAHPGASITLLATRAGAQVAPMLPWVADVMVRRPIWQEVSPGRAFDPAEEQAFIAQLAARRFDAAFIFTSFSQTPFPPAYACYLAGIPVRYGETKEFGGQVLTRAAAPLPDAAHQVDRNLHLLREAGVAVRDTRLQLSVPASAAARVRQLLTEASLAPGTPYTVFAPGASCDSRRYDPLRLAEAARDFAERAGVPVVVAGTEGDRPLGAAIAGALPPKAAVDLTGQTSVPELAALIRGAAVVVANNSGPLHFADAFGRPVVVLYSGTDLESQWRPRHAPAVLLRRPTPCTPCYAFRCRYEHECLDIPPREVAGAALRLLDRSERAWPSANIEQELVIP